MIWYCGPLALTSFQWNLRSTSGLFGLKITGFSPKMAAILDFCYLGTSTHQIRLEYLYDLIWHIFMSKWPYFL
jgi:hypothetical protein